MEDAITNKDDNRELCDTERGRISEHAARCDMDEGRHSEINICHPEVFLNT